MVKDYVMQHQGLAVVGLLIFCLIVAYLEYRVLKNKDAAYISVLIGALPAIVYGAASLLGVCPNI